MNKKIIGLNAFFLACASIMAQDVQNTPVVVQQLDEVVVSDSRFALKRENSGKTVIKISTEELERNQGKSVAEIINTKSGIEIAGSRGRQGAIYGVFARGGRGRQVLIIIDGVRVSDPASFSSEYDLRMLSTANVESIEILKGAASTLYGTNAATAVIHITTKRAVPEAIGIHVQSSVGTNQNAKHQNNNLSQFSNAARLSGSLDKFTYNVGFTSAYSEGLSSLVTATNEEDPFSRITTDLKLGYKFSDALDVTLYGNHSKYNNAFDESFGLMDAPYSQESEQKRAGISAAYTYGKGAVHFNAAYSDYHSDSQSGFPTIFNGENIVGDLYHKYTFNDTWYTILGLNYIKDKAVFSSTADFNIIDPYFNMVYVSPVGLNVNAGLRLNNHSEYGSHLVYNLNPSYAIATEEGYVKLLGSYATSYITPNLTQLFGNFGANPDLEPEENSTIEAGVEYAINGSLRVSALYFNRREKNTIGFDSNFVSVNVADLVKARGSEVEFFWDSGKKLRLNTNYTFTELEGSTGIRIPKHKVNAELGYSFCERTQASITYTYTGKRFDTDFNSFPATDVALDPFSLVSCYIEHELMPNKLTLYVSANNIFNEEYTEVLGFTTLGRNFRMGLNLNL